MLDIVETANHSHVVDGTLTYGDHMLDAAKQIASIGSCQRSRLARPQAKGASAALALDWMESHVRIMAFWEDRLVADNGDPALIDMLHRQAAWLEMMMTRMGRG